MSDTGYTVTRAKPHEAFSERVISTLAERGYEPIKLKPNGDGPDIRLGDGSYIELKTRGSAQSNYAIKLGCMNHARSSSEQIYFVFDNGRVNTIDTLRPVRGRHEGPQRPTANGSNTNFLLVEPNTGCKFDDFFPPQ